MSKKSSPFQDALRKILSVNKEDVDREVARQKAAKAKKKQVEDQTGKPIDPS